MRSHRNTQGSTIFQNVPNVSVKFHLPKVSGRSSGSLVFFEPLQGSLKFSDDSKGFQTFSNGPLKCAEVRQRSQGFAKVR